jgi:hypothetical protein
MTHPAAGIPEDKVASVLARAAELDRQVVSVDALRAAALEAGISATAVDRAIAEFEAGVDREMFMNDVATERAAGFWQRVLRKARPAVELAAAGLVLGMLGSRMIAIPLLASLAITILLARRTREDETADFHGRITLVTLAMAIGLLGAGGHRESGFILAVAGIVELLFGSLYIVTRDAEHRSSAPTPL